MKTKLAQLVYFFNKIDRRHIQFAYFAFMLAVFIMNRSPADGGTGPIR